MNKKDIEKYIKILKIDSKAKYMLVISIDSGISPEDAARLKLSENFLDEILMIQGDPHKLISQIKITK